MQTTEENIKSGLNNTGVFLESIIFRSLHGHSMIKATREEPYSGFTSEGFEGTIDVFAVIRVQTDTLIVLCIECKKADPNQKHWVFDRRSTETNESFPFEYLEATANKINYDKNIFFPSLGYEGKMYFDQAIETFEFNEVSGSLSRNQIERPYFALLKANEAISSFIDEKKERIFELMEISNGSRTNLLFIPLVVTTANLSVAEYKENDISRQNGTIPIDKINLIPKQWIHYEFPLPYKLVTRYNREKVGLAKRPSFIVNSESFPDFIDLLIADCGRYILPEE